VIVSGSKTDAIEQASWIDRLLDLIREAVAVKIPYLGVCFGHQMLARAFGEVTGLRKSQRPEYGWVEVRNLEQSPLTRDLPRQFYSFAAHFDEVSVVPAGFRVLANSECCSVQACQLANLPVYGIQFHPEKNLEEGEKILQVRDDMQVPKELLNRHRGHLLYNPDVGRILIRNFLQGDVLSL
jgi:GMP synthase-like glutamine amidotransferase